MALGVMRNDDTGWLDVPVFVDLDQLVEEGVRKAHDRAVDLGENRACPAGPGR